MIIWICLVIRRKRLQRRRQVLLKESVPVVISETQQAVKEIFISHASSSGSPVNFADSLFLCSLGEPDITSATRKYEVTDLRSRKIYEGLIPLCGDYQSRNLQAVFCSIEKLRTIFRISDANISEGIRNVISNTGLAGRWQIIGTMPLTICDTAHNREGLEYVTAQLTRIPRSELHIVLGFVNDKDLGSVLPLFPSGARYYFTRAAVPRALDEVILKTEAARFGLSGQCFPDVKSALAKARENAAASDLIFIGGSTFVVAEAIQKEIVEKIMNKSDADS